MASSCSACDNRFLNHSIPFAVSKRTVHVAIPAMGESQWLPHTLDQVMAEGERDLHLWVCVNQPDSWWHRDDKRSVCLDNQKTLAYLRSLEADNLHVIDRSSSGNGWPKKQEGVGHARKHLMDCINKQASDEDILISLDADTLFDKGYIGSVRECFEKYPGALALSNPYFHPLSGDEILDRAMLRYEIYMRYYSLNMWRIRSPYSFTALGSAIALPIKSYRKVGGITPKKSGEDFYFLQKLRKAGWICNVNAYKVYPATRYSDRVFFGTGPALIKGSKGDWNSYPLYAPSLFDQVEATCALFPGLYHQPMDTPMSDFLSRQFREADPFAALRKNTRNQEQFVKACHQKVDGLRILQFLKSESNREVVGDEENLLAWLERWYPDHAFSTRGTVKAQGPSLVDPTGWEELDFQNSELSLLDKIRRFLQYIEVKYQEANLP